MKSSMENSGQALEFKQLNMHALEASDRGQEIHMQAAPTGAKLLHKNYRMMKQKQKSQTKRKILQKYRNAATEEGIPREILYGQTEGEVENDHAGRIIKGQEMALPRSKYEEDLFISSHTSV